MAHCASIVALGSAVPSFALAQEHADRLFTRYYRRELSERSREVLRQVLRHKSIRKRHIAVDSLENLKTLKNEDRDVRIARFTRWAVRLSREALEKALESAGLRVQDISVLIVNTCTGYICPGISTYLVEDMRMKPSVQVYDLVGSGCGGAIPNLQLAEAIVRGDPTRIVACISVEVSSAAFEMDNDIGLLVSNAIFGDGAAAAIIRGSAESLDGQNRRSIRWRLEETASACLPEAREYVRFVHRDGRLFNRLDPRLPAVIRDAVPTFIRELLARRSLAVGDVGCWALHPGGEKILSAVQEKLKLTDADLTPSREMLALYGNMSSPSVLFVLERIMMEKREAGSWCLMAAYGAGLSIHGYLLHAEG